ncbi:MAG TPA: DUF2141 domain-containing protein [Gemmatimonadaceae bacterium]|nr:DUF2141 domain-containing protein [Gemmatimonadaceae bacterium]
MPFLLALALFGLVSSQPSTARLTVRLVEVRPEKKGQLHVSVHRAPGEAFPGPSPLLNEDAPLGGRESMLTFEVTPGTYAVAVHHDANANGRMDVNFLQIPKEGYGISNDPRPKFRAPRFDEARVIVSRDTTVVIRMSY